MNTFNENDVTIEHDRLGGGRGRLRLIHGPSGLSVDVSLKSGPLIEARNTLMNDLRERVLNLEAPVGENGFRPNAVLIAAGRGHENEGAPVGG